MFYILLGWKGFAMWLRFIFFFKDTILTTLLLLVSDQGRTNDLGLSI